MTSHTLRNSSKNMRHTPADAPAAPHLLCGVTPRSLAYRLLCGAAPAILGTLAATVTTVDVAQAQQQVGAIWSGGAAATSGATASGIQVYAVGANANATGSKNIAVGQNAIATGTSGATALGPYSNATDTATTAVGLRANATDAIGTSLRTASTIIASR